MRFTFKCYSKYNHDFVIFASALNNWYMRCNNRFKTIQNARQRVYMQQRGKEAKEPDYRLYTKIASNKGIPFVRFLLNNATLCAIQQSRNASRTRIRNRCRPSKGDQIIIYSAMESTHDQEKMTIEDLSRCFTTCNYIH